MEISVKIPEKLAAQARARGLKLEIYVQEILARQGEKYLCRALQRRSAPGLTLLPSSPTRFRRYQRPSRASGFTRTITRWRLARVWSTRTSCYGFQGALNLNTRSWTLRLPG